MNESFIYVWDLSGSDSVDLLKLIKHILIVKHKHAEIVLQLAALPKYNRWHPVPDQQLELRQQLCRTFPRPRSLGIT